MLVTGPSGRSVKRCINRSFNSAAFSSPICSMAHRNPLPNAIRQKSSGSTSSCCPFSSTAPDSSSGTASSIICSTPSSVVMRSQGLKSLTNSGATSASTAFHSVYAGSKRRGPHVVIASRPPGRSSRQSRRTCSSISGTKKIPKTTITASKRSGPKGNAVMSAFINPTFRSPRAAAFPRANASKLSARSTPTTLPDATTASAAGSAEAPVPQQTSSTRMPGFRPSRSTVRRP